ncbi:MAG: DNA polymerase III subunit beta [Endomicrobium sp.]|jgi:DNA polymerase-3 subunit beta|nr:DNA polymerase III subunit beta [Endomicrobium sp.]
MRVICEKEELMKGMKIISTAVPLKNTISILSNFMFTAEEDRIKLCSTDLEITLQYYIKGKILKKGSVTIPAKKFACIVKELTFKNEIQIETNDENYQIDISSGKSKFSIIGLSCEGYPIIPEFPKEANFCIEKEIFASMLKRTIFATSKDSQRYVLNGIYFIIEDNEFKMISTDGRRLAYIKFDKLITIPTKQVAIVPAKAINEMLKLFTLDVLSKVIKINITANKIAVKIGEVVLTSTLIEGIFPDYEQVIPKTYKFIVKLDVKNTLMAVKQMAILTNEKFLTTTSSAVEFYFTTDILKISASTSGIGFGEVKIAIDYKNEPIKISFNPNFIKDVLQNINEDFTLFKFSDFLNPVVITPEIYTNYVCVVMPLRI